MDNLQKLVQMMKKYESFLLDHYEYLTDLYDNPEKSALYKESNDEVFKERICCKIQTMDEVLEKFYECFEGEKWEKRKEMTQGKGKE